MCYTELALAGLSRLTTTSCRNTVWERQDGEPLYGRGKNAWFPWQGLPVHTNGHIPLAKLHGSLSWDSERKYTDGRAGVRGTALIVPPSPEKRPPNELSHVWELGAKILEACRRLVVFGFAFNPYDTALLEFLKQNGRRLQSVLVVDIVPQLARARSLWPKAKIEWFKPRDQIGIAHV